MSTRNTSFDSIKYILIVCVVFGHTFQLDMEGLNEKLFTFIYSFHMPAFVLISGYFYKDNGKEKFWKSILELLLVVLIFQVLLFSKGAGWKDPFDFSLSGIVKSIAHLYYPKAAMWYLLSLALWRVMMRFIPTTYREKAMFMIPLTIVLSLLVGFIPLGAEFSFQRTFFFFPFFYLGYHIKKSQLWGKIRSIKKKNSLGIIIVYILVVFFIPNFPDSMLTGSFHYMSGIANWKIMLLLRACSYLWVLPLTISVLSIIPDNSIFARNGQDTLFYFLFHPFFIKLMYLGTSAYKMPTCSACLLFYTIVSMMIMYWMAKIPFLTFLTKPLFFKNSNK